jgi:hypothetical protein
MIAVDIVGFGAAERNNQVQIVLREAMYTALRYAFTEAGLRWQDCHREDRGDGVFIALPPTIPSSIVDALALHLRAGLRRHNMFANDQARICLRMAAHAGPIHLDDHGITGHAVIHLFRLLNAPNFKEMIADSTSELGLIVSDDLYRTVICHSSSYVDATEYRPLTVKLKETHCQAWTCMPLGTS